MSSGSPPKSTVFYQPVFAVKHQSYVRIMSYNLPGVCLTGSNRTNDEFVGYLHSKSAFHLAFVLFLRLTAGYMSSFLPNSTPAEIAELAALYPDDPTQVSISHKFLYSPQIIW